VTSFVTDPSDCRILAFGSSRFEKIAEPHNAMTNSTTTKINTSPTTSGSAPVRHLSKLSNHQPHLLGLCIGTRGTATVERQVTPLFGVHLLQPAGQIA